MQTPLETVTLHNRNTAWCGVLASELVAADVALAVLCCGARSSAMALALHAQPEIETVVFNDERAGAFFALGWSKSTGRPAVVCTTSGSAVANLLPALVEAKATGVPLIALTCDRPRTIRDAGATQCADHLGLCQAVVEGSVDLGDPVITRRALLSLRKEVRELLGKLDSQTTRGPLQINIPLHGELTSMDVDDDWNPPKYLPSLVRAPARLPPSPKRKVASASRPFNKLRLRSGLKGLIAVGPDCPIDVRRVSVFAEKTGFPVIADAPSGLRRPAALQNVICNGDLLSMNWSVAELRPDLLIRLGNAPVSHTMHRYLRAQRCPVIRIDRRPLGRDFLASDSLSLSFPSDGTLNVLADTLAPGDSAWAEQWKSLDDRVNALKNDYLSSLPWGDCKAAWMVCNTRGFDLFHLGNSMAARHANLYCDATATAQKIMVNRGVSGIDGNTATFLGELRGNGGSGLLLIGDLAAAHDLTGLEAGKLTGLRGVICIINNRGGAIFDLLSVADMPDYERLIRNPVALDFRSIAAAFQIPFTRCETEKQLSAAMGKARLQRHLSIIEIRVPETSLKRDLPQLYWLTMTA
ncbi:MAG TPA: 2-succinyl-5-enolpyruvyl-6-hydroxy-3-cyclohexene-1-carboxylic-acid synthase [Pyrinomonadaceae bacterium]|nr:2-succinyl-5-enolpyruvyl-6-hydroxy-3-cyclohexene-1-carboxylic-acid synthase [Pyrinomonadaceae bacterium]